MNNAADGVISYQKAIQQGMVAVSCSQTPQCDCHPQTRMQCLTIEVSFLIIADPNMLSNSLNIAGSTLTKFWKATQAHSLVSYIAHTVFASATMAASTISFSYMPSSFGSWQWLINFGRHPCLVELGCWLFEVFPLHPLWDLSWLKRRGL